MYKQKLYKLKPKINEIIVAAKKYFQRFESKEDNMLKVGEVYEKREKRSEKEKMREEINELRLKVSLYKLNNDELLLVNALMFYGRDEYIDVKEQPEQNEKIYQEVFEKTCQFELGQEVCRTRIVNNMLEKAPLAEFLKSGLEMLNI